jgi:hypothetical protein
MTEALTRHRLEGLEPDNLLAFLALLGLLLSLEAADRQRPAGDKLYPRASWNLDSPPLRPVLSVAQPVTRKDVAEAAANGLSVLATSHNFGENNRKDLNYPRDEARAMLVASAHAATALARDPVDLLAALMCDAAVKEDKSPDAAPIAPTPLCLMFGQGHQHFLDRLAKIPAEVAPPPRGKGKAVAMLSATECVAEALFAPWHREDPTFSFRWDPEEDVRYALMAGDPADPTYKGGTQHGANRLAAVGLAALTLIPETRGGKIRPSVLGGSWSPRGFSFAWPIWSQPATLSAIRALLGHPELRESDHLAYLGVDHVRVANRISVGKFMNFTRARILDHG